MTYSEVIDNQTVYYTTSKTYVVNVESIDNFKISTQISKNIDTSPILDSNKQYITLTGIVPNRTIKAITINGIQSELKWTWRQFDFDLLLHNGLNEIVIKGYSDLACTQEIASETYYVQRKVIENFKVTSNLSKDYLNPTKVSGSTTAVMVTGLVLNPNINNIMVNGQYDLYISPLGQFDTTYPLQIGMNCITVMGRKYSPGTQTIEILGYQNFFVYREEILPEETIENFKISTTVSKDPSTAPVVYSNVGSMVLTGVVSNPNIQTIKINGQVIFTKWAWRQFDFNMDLNWGVNEIVIEGYSDAVTMPNIPQNKIVTEKYYIIRAPYTY